jgi:hypothetical protein
VGHCPEPMSTPTTGVERAGAEMEGRVQRSPWLLAAWLLVLSVPAGLAAYYRIFSQFASWDDEGTELAMVKQYLTGAKLYQEVFSPYGPVYYFYNWLLHSVLGVPLTHDAVRITWVIVVLVCAGGCAWLVYHFTQSLAVATVVHLAVFQGMQFLKHEPGHPQELALMLMIGLVTCGMFTATPRWRLVGLAACGDIAACLLLIKVNLGIFAILAVMLAVVFQGPAGRLMRLARFAAGAAALALPFLLMRSHLDDPAGLTYCFLVTVSMAALLAGPLRSVGDGWFSYADCIAVLTSFAGTAGVVLLVMVAQGVPLPQLLNMLVLKHVGLSVQQRVYYLALELGWRWTLPIWIAWGAAGLGAAVMVARAERSGSGAARKYLAPAQFLFGCAGLIYALADGKLLMGFVPPFCWLILYPPVHSGTRGARARVLLCTAAVLQALTAYPMAGSQEYFIRILPIVIAGIALVDGLRALPIESELGALAFRFARPVAVLVLIGVSLGYPVMAVRGRALYASLIPLALPGAERVHLEPAEVEQFHWLVDNINRNCDTFVGLPQYPSLYFWTGKALPGPAHKPPGGLSMDTWMLTHSAEEQQAVVDDLEQHPNACAIYSPRGVYFWYKSPPDLSGSPLATYILTRFKVVGQDDQFSFMIRKERQFDQVK